MPSSTARVPTAQASRYLQQLSKHWSHKYPVTFDPASSHIDLGEGRTLAMAASATTLDVRATAPDDTTLARFQIVVEDHLRRFAFKETLTFDWTPAP